jgi:hypothetical protein
MSASQEKKNLWKLKSPSLTEGDFNLFPCNILNES